MTHKYFLFALLLLTFSKDYAQSENDTSNIVYEPISKDIFKEYKNAKLVVDYFFTDGFSNQDRYSYEIIIMDSLLMINFSSPETDSYNYISYDKKSLLDDSKLDNIKQVIKSIQFKQIKNGIPRATFSAYTKEVLIVRYKNLSIAGGLVYANIASYSDNEPANQVNKEIADDRKQSSSISGNYDLLISALKKYFMDFDKLKTQSLKE